MLRERWRKMNQKGASEDKQSPPPGFLEVLVRDSGGAQPAEGCPVSGVWDAIVCSVNTPLWSSYKGKVTGNEIGKASTLLVVLPSQNHT